MGANVRVTTGASVGQCAARSRSGGGSASVGTPATSLPAFIVPVDIHSQDPGPGFNCYLIVYSGAHVHSRPCAWLGPPIYLFAFIFGHNSPEMKDFHATLMATPHLLGVFLDQERHCGHNRGGVRSAVAE